MQGPASEVVALDSRSYHKRNSIDDTYDMGGRVGVGVAPMWRSTCKLDSYSYSYSYLCFLLIYTLPPPILGPAHVHCKNRYKMSVLFLRVDAAGPHQTLPKNT